jgi:acyl-CoA thioester hydrolase
MCQERPSFTYRVQVIWRDLDALNHVNNAVYFTYFEEARLRFYGSVGIEPDVPNGMGIILAEACCRYRSQLRLGERIQVSVEVASVGNSSFILEYHVRAQDGRDVADGRTVQVCFDYSSQHSVPIPEPWREALVLRLSATQGNEVKETLEDTKSPKTSS